MEVIEYVFQFGIAGISVFFIYDLAKSVISNRFDAIEERLKKIEEKLD